MTRPCMPQDLDDAMFEAMMDAVGQDLAFRAVEAAWIVMVDWCLASTTDAHVAEIVDGGVFRGSARNEPT